MTTDHGLHNCPVRFARVACRSSIRPRCVLAILPGHRPGSRPGGPRHQHVAPLCIPRGVQAPPTPHTHGAAGARNQAVCVAHRCRARDAVTSCAGEGDRLHTHSIGQRVAASLRSSGDEEVSRQRYDQTQAERGAHAPSSSKVAIEVFHRSFPKRDGGKRKTFRSFAPGFANAIGGRPLMNGHPPPGKKTTRQKLPPSGSARPAEHFRG